MIAFVIPGLCLLACTASIFLLQRRRRAKPLDYGLQLAIWLSAWMLWQPPALVTAGRHIELDSEDLAGALPVTFAGVKNISLSGVPPGRDALRDLAPVRLDLSNLQVSDTGWGFHWPRQIALGEALQLQIHSEQPLAESARLALVNPYGDIEESLELKAGEKVQAQLSATPKLTGPQLFRVQIENAAGESRFDPLPIVVQEPRQPRVLLWLARPAFESAALSRWLRQSGVAAQVVTQLAPEIVREETLNGLQSIGSLELMAVTSPFHLLILDSDLWPQLSPQQKQQLSALASQKSLLWLVRSDASEAFLHYSAAQSMPLQKAENTKPDTDSFTDLNDQNTDNPTTPSLRPLGFQAMQSGPSDFLLGDRENPLFWGRSTDTQHLGFILFSDSHRWLTSGFATEFTSLWKSIFDYQLKHLGTQQPITLSGALPRAQERITLCSPQFIEKHPLLFDSQDKPLSVDGIAANGSPQGQCHNFWARNSGWHQLKTKNSREPPFDFYIFAKDDWPLWQQSLSAIETRQMAAARLGPIDNTHSARVPIARHWPALILLVLVCLSWWRERALLR
ncbi:hypothetical protein [Microbulbifer spongiae]|uniref:DUF4350 domain-containing protein n=1 Tax=Microbulbifer spongiae TaxID=2944933 RepID=A0ABY9EAJ5_9GAMM|nr:hypothetical protein [Microbulbifer sp. MI-G]WKD49480.1 hypothetical protein M8T91_16535 [Microbulbifer sp. MI-G]